MKKNRAEAPPSAREQAYADLLRKALERPGIREVMQVYENWREVDHALAPYRAATREPEEITTTDHTNQR